MAENSVNMPPQGPKAMTPSGKCLSNRYRCHVNRLSERLWGTERQKPELLGAHGHHALDIVTRRELAAVVRDRLREHQAEGVEEDEQPM